MSKAQNIDKFGHCILCHKCLLKNVVINGKQEALFDANKDEVWVQLNNGALMSISVCKPCKSQTDFNDDATKTQVLRSVQLGWQLEMDLMSLHPQKYPDFSSDKRLGLEAFYSSLTDYKWIKDFSLS